MVEFQCKDGLNESRALLVFEYIIKRKGYPVESSRGSSVATPTPIVEFQCRDVLNESRALLVLQYIIKKDRVLQ